MGQRFSKALDHREDGRITLFLLPPALYYTTLSIVSIHRCTLFSQYIYNAMIIIKATLNTKRTKLNLSYYEDRVVRM